MHVCAPVVAHRQAAELSEPGEGALDLPAVASEPFGVVDTAPSDARDDAAGAALPTAPAMVISLVGVELVWAASRTPLSSTDRRHRWEVERTLAWLAQFRRLAVRHDRRANVHIALTTLGVTVICMRQVRRFCP